MMCLKELCRVTCTAAAIVLSIASIASAGELPALRVRQTGVNAQRIIEDVNGKPFFVAGWNPQDIVMVTPTADFDACFKTRHEQGINMAWICIAPFDWSVNGNKPTPEHWNPMDFAGNRLMLNPTAGGPYGSLEPSNLNRAYVASVDAVIDAAANNGVYILLCVVNEMGGGAGQQFFRRGAEESYNWGRFWGERYALQPHVQFSVGNDVVSQPQGNEVVRGVNEEVASRGGPPRLWTYDVGSPEAAYNADPKVPQDPVRAYLKQGCTWMNLWAWYAYEYPDKGPSRPSCWTYQYATWLMYTQTWAKPAPTFCMESEYSEYGSKQAIGEGTGITHPKGFPNLPGHWAIRRQMWSGPLGGATGFGILGNINECRGDSRKYLDDPIYAVCGKLCQAFFASRHWEQLAPDYAHTFLTSQTTNPTRTDPKYVSAALALDGSFGVIYHPGLAGMDRSITVDLSRLGGGEGTSTARWFDPTNGHYIGVEGSPFSNSGKQTLSIPKANSLGGGDWVLLLETPDNR